MQKQNIKNFLWNTVGTSLNAFSSLLYLIIVTRINGIDISGIFSYCFSFSIIIYTASNIGSRIYEVSDKEGYGDSTFFTLKFYTCGLGILSCGLYYIISGFDLQKTVIIFIFMIIRTIEAFSDTIYAVFQKNERLDYVGISYTIKNLCAFALFFIVDYVSEKIFHLDSSIYLATLSILLATVLTYYLYDKIYLKKFLKLYFVRDFKKVVSLFKDVRYFIVFSLLTIVIPNVPRIIVEMKFSHDELGYFSILIMIPTIMILLAQLIIQPFVTSMTEKYAAGQYKQILRQTIIISILIALCCVACSAAAYFLGPFVLKLLYSLSFEEYKMSLVILVMAGMFNAFSTLLSTVLTIFRKTAFQLVIYVGVLAFEALIMYVQLGTYGFTHSFTLYMLMMILQFIAFAVYFAIEYRKKALSAT